MVESGDRQRVELELKGRVARRPPQEELLFDLRLHNGADGDRWYLLPAELDVSVSAASGKGGVDGVEAWSTPKPERVVVGRFQGSGGCQAMLLPAGAEVTVRGFPIELWEDAPAGVVEVVVRVVTDLRVGGEPAADWFEVDPRSAARAEVEHADLERAGSRFTPTRVEVPLTFTELARVPVKVSFPSKSAVQPRP